MDVGDQHAGLDALARQSLAAGFSWGVEVIAGRSGGVCLHRVYGQAQRDPDRPLVADLRFDMASVTKVVATATACAICVDQGLVDPEAPLRRYLPAVGHEGGDVRLRDLATHTSGHDNAKPYHQGQPSGDAFVAAALATRPVRPPGVRYEYACINYILLGLVVEAVTGQRLDRFCQARIFGPLGMADSGFGPVGSGRERLVKMPAVDLGEISDEGARMAGRPLGNAGLFSTASDLARYGVMVLRHGEHAAGRVLSRRAVDLMQTRLPPADCPPRSFGWNLAADLRPAGFSERTVYHTGWTGQSLYLDPERDAFVVVLSNRTGDHGRAMEVRRDLAAAAAREMGTRA